jgi:hypothetical protein
MNAFALLSLVYFIFSVLAVFFFKDITHGVYIEFQKFYSVFNDDAPSINRRGLVDDNV